MTKILTTLVGLLMLGTMPAHADGGSAEPALRLCPSADATSADATFCVYDVPRLPSESPTFFIRKNGTKVTISPARAARKLTRWGYVLDANLFWRFDLEPAHQ